MRTRPPCKAFTLIELLTVMATLSVLMAVLLPSWQAARHLAYRTRCQSNERQLAVAWRLYADDHNGHFYRGDRNYNYNFGGWRGTSDPCAVRPLNRYLSLPDPIKDERQAEIYRCPADMGGDDYARSAFTHFGNSYQANYILIGETRPMETRFSEPWQTLFTQINQSSESLKWDNIARPDQLVLVGDHNWASQWDPTNLWYCGRAWHQKRHHYNLAFLDGHIVFIKVQKGLLLTDDYRIYPSTDIDPLVSTLQTPIPCVCEIP